MLSTCSDFAEASILQSFPSDEASTVCRICFTTVVLAARILRRIQNMEDYGRVKQIMAFSKKILNPAICLSKVGEKI
jgi:hypothetical protein